MSKPVRLQAAAAMNSQSPTDDDFAGALQLALAGAVSPAVEVP